MRIRKCLLICLRVCQCVFTHLLVCRGQVKGRSRWYAFLLDSSDMLVVAIEGETCKRSPLMQIRRVFLDALSMLQSIFFNMSFLL